MSHGMRSVLVIVLAMLLSPVTGAEPVKAYRELVFVESRKEVDQRIRADRKVLKGNTYSCTTTLAGEMYGMEFSFDQDRLFFIKFTANYVFSTSLYSASRFDKVLDEMDTLRTIIEAQYGPPHETADIKLWSVKDSSPAYKYYWNIDGVKFITIGAATRKYEYWAEMSIGYMPIFAEISARLDQQKRDAAAGSAIDF